MADINDRLDRLHRREAFDRRVAEPGTSMPADEPRPGGTAASAAAPGVAAPGSASQWSRSGLPQRGPVPPGPAQPGAAEQRSQAGLPQRVPADPATPAWPPPAYRSMPVAPTQPAGPHQWSRSGLPQRSPAQVVAAGGSAHPAPADPPQLVQGGSAQLAAAEPVHVADRQPAPMSPPTPRPAGVDDRLGEVLDAVAEVVRRHPGLSVMVALADGSAGRPVIRVTERDGGVDTGLVVPGAESRPEPAPQPERAPQPEPERESRRPGGRHAAPATDDAGNGEHASGPEAGADPARSTPPGPPARSSWHDSLWSADRAAAATGDAVPDHRTEHGALRLVPELEPAAGTGTSQVVSRLAQLLREDPSLASSWGREAPDS